jgi:putative two-component system response regulator
LIERSQQDAGILVVDDEAPVVKFLVRALEGAGYRRVRGLTDPSEMLPLLADRSLDLIVLDLRMPDVDGFRILEEVRRRVGADEYLPVIVVSGLNDPDSRTRAILAGARDYLAKPIEVREFLARVGSLLETRFINLRLRETRLALEELFRRRTREAQGAQLELLDRLSRVAEVREDPSGEHPARVGRLAGMIAQELLLPEEEILLLMRAAPLHDLGKVALPDRILLKEGAYTEAERLQMQEHTTLGAGLLRGANSDLMKMAEQIALSHHERWDGSGYPQGLRGEQIPLVARIVAVADAFDAMIHPRLHREALTVSAALDELSRESGAQFDPQVVTAFLRAQEWHPAAAFGGSLVV